MTAQTPPDFDQLVRTHTAFASMQDMLDAKGYRPSLYTFRPPIKLIADEYDRLQAERNDNRRAFRHDS